MNDDLELAAVLRYNVSELPRIAEWKALRDAENGSAFDRRRSHGREKRIESGKAEIFRPMESRFARFEIEIADGREKSRRLSEKSPVGG